MKCWIKIYLVFLFLVISCKTASYEIVAPRAPSGKPEGATTAPDPFKSVPTASTPVATPTPETTPVATPTPETTPVATPTTTSSDTTPTSTVPAPTLPGGTPISWIPGTSIPAMPGSPLVPYAHVITMTGAVTRANPIFIKLSCFNKSVAYYYDSCRHVYVSCLKPLPIPIGKDGGDKIGPNQSDLFSPGYR